ncbi:MAG: conjugal transfer protein TraB, partial [Pseudomonadota bacterium]
MADNTSQGSGSQSAIGQGSAKRAKLNSAIAQRQKLLLGGIGVVALIAGSMFIFGGEDAQDDGA